MTLTYNDKFIRHAQYKIFNYPINLSVAGLQ
ncbi:hypothetical protein SAMN05192529_101155 [Arachidicoccus rhizosphaerae]|uniref:Uncharacterized protein n=1 Tax=Arachidicoccus rhizosphaerae TaxID=551991 RepID=A0A1H3VI18_9BACT|nr:hypothetical protein SAMN05192529_101155 [Arachidicoccus rhizosphaerae]